MTYKKIFERVLYDHICDAKAHEVSRALYTQMEAKGYVLRPDYTEVNYDLTKPDDVYSDLVLRDLDTGLLFSERKYKEVILECLKELGFRWKVYRKLFEKNTMYGEIHGKGIYCMLDVYNIRSPNLVLKHLIVDLLRQKFNSGRNTNTIW